MTALSIIVCTYNRAELLRLCLSAIEVALAKTPNCELVVVDNGSTDHTLFVVKDYQTRLPIKYIVEETLGLSYARNTGAKLATGNWLLYLDDDGQIRPDGIYSCIETIGNYDFKMFTGIYKAWYRTPAPVWFPGYVGDYVLKGANTIRELGHDYISGGIMTIEKSTLEASGFFPVNLGMSGTNVAYGEETYVEQLLRSKDIAVGINPFMIMDHLVAEYKYSIRWILQSAFASKRDTHSIQPYQLSTAFKSTLKIGWHILTGLPRAIKSSKSNHQGHYKSTLLCWLTPVAEEYGKIYAIFRSKF